MSNPRKAAKPEDLMGALECHLYLEMTPTEMP